MFSASKYRPEFIKFVGLPEDAQYVGIHSDGTRVYLMVASDQEDLIHIHASLFTPSADLGEKLMEEIRLFQD